MRTDELEHIEVKLNSSIKARWLEEYGITGLYLNDIAAGALIQVSEDWSADEAVKKVSAGLRHLSQELWSRNLPRPVVAVFWGSKDNKAVKALDRLSWDQEQHRGDFALRWAKDEDDAKELLWTLMGDTLGELDKNARADKVGVAEVRESLHLEGDAVGESQESWAKPAGRLINDLIEELDRTRKGSKSSETVSPVPDLIKVLDGWLQNEGVLP